MSVFSEGQVVVELYLVTQIDAWYIVRGGQVEHATTDIRKIRRHLAPRRGNRRPDHARLRAVLSNQRQRPRQVLPLHLVDDDVTPPPTRHANRVQVPRLEVSV